jgi:hypothetical protein
MGHTPRPREHHHQAHDQDRYCWHTALLTCVCGLPFDRLPYLKPPVATMQLDCTRFSGTITAMKTRRVTRVPRDARHRPDAPQVAAGSQRHAQRCGDAVPGAAPSL